MKPASLVLVLLAGIAACVGCAGSDRAAREAAERDYRRLSGTWQLTRAIVDGNPVPEAQVKATVLITDGNTFRFPQASGVGTHKRACWRPPGRPRPTGFDAPPGSGRILQYWEKVGPVPRGT
jgi:hypothetical protein